MPRSRKTRTNLTASTNHRLNSYALAAGAAGVSLLALAQPADAEVVYTPANVTVSRNGSYKLDLNNDGIVDFFIVEHAEFSRRSPDSTQSVWVSAPAGNHVQCIPYGCYSSNSYVATALSRGNSIGSRGPWIVNPIALWRERK
jgi:hypothetical protein